MRRVLNVPPAVAEETVVSTPSTSEVIEDDSPPVISRFDNNNYPPSDVSPPPAPHRIVINRPAPAAPNQKVLLIRRNDGTTQYLRPVVAPGRGIEPVSRLGEAPQTVRRVVASVAGRPGTIVRTLATQPTRVVRVAPGGQQIVNRLSGTRVVATRTPTGLDSSLGQPHLRQSATATVQQQRIVQRVMTRGGATMAMGQRIVQSQYQEDVGLTRPLKNPREIGYKAKVPDVARVSYSSRPYRFDFESNEDEERAIAEAIAREEELMAQEEEENKNSQERQWNYPRIIDKFGQVGTAMLHNLARQPLQYKSNLMPTKEDSAEQKQIKQTLDSLITQVCRWDKQYGWFKNHQKKPKSRQEMDKLKSRRMFSNQRELMLAEHVERLRREINKRRTRMENEAERLCGLPTPWRKARTKSAKRESFFGQTVIENK